MLVFKSEKVEKYLKRCHLVASVECFKGDIREIIESHKTIKRWAYILHDKDEAKPHYHIYLDFENSGVGIKKVAEWFGLQESQVSEVKGRAIDMFRYLTHDNYSQKNKYQYSPTEVVTNFGIELKNWLILGNFEKYSYEEQLAYVNSLPDSEKNSASRILDKCWKMYSQYMML